MTVHEWKNEIDREELRLIANGFWAWKSIDFS